MPLPEDEQRQLQEIEQALYRDDPKFGHLMRASDPRVQYECKLRHAVLMARRLRFITYLRRSRPHNSPSSPNTPANSTSRITGTTIAARTTAVPEPGSIACPAYQAGPGQAAPGKTG